MKKHMSFTDPNAIHARMIEKRESWKKHAAEKAIVIIITSQNITSGRKRNPRQQQAHTHTHTHTCTRTHMHPHIPLDTHETGEGR